MINSVLLHGVKFRRFVVDNYGEDLSVCVPKISALLDKQNIPYEVRDYCSEDMHCGGWIDYGSLEKPIHTIEETKQLFSKCAYPNIIKFCFSIRNGKIIPCPPINRRLMLNQNVAKKDYIDIMDNTISIKEQRCKISNIYNAKYLESCKYCNGMCDDSPRFKPAEQFTLDEYKQIRQSLPKRL